MEHANPKPRGRPPKPTQGRGEIRGDCLYPISVLLRKLGISRNTLTSMRRRGLPCHLVTAKCGLIDGREFIEFLRAEWQRQSEANGVDRVEHQESEQPP